MVRNTKVKNYIIIRPPSLIFILAFTSGSQQNNRKKIKITRKFNLFSYTLIYRRLGDGFMYNKNPERVIKYIKINDRTKTI